ncbi:hypothetical protein SBA5_100083 [Candidatus Sulfotelmatomonas gaucii]|uniref:Uncharacterized protein n=1 Tax=Candidatus Sulfuritelmatomonas gaucii TaxID=2043161 RepID=A0A2N9L3E0_9BACT|nr:hypothetical protein SBA5_100083 [Candidatus Sulfotelmatomonas gaucii]
MGCSVCTYLECALQRRHGEYVTACSETFRRVSSELAAYNLVEMERARSELKVHRSECISAIAAAVLQRSLIPAA